MIFGSIVELGGEILHKPRYVMRLFAPLLGFIGCILAFVDASHFANGFGPDYFKLGLGHHSWLWWHCGQIGFGFIMAAFLTELTHHFLARRTLRPKGDKSIFASRSSRIALVVSL